MTLPELNALPPDARAQALRTCCGATRWVAEMNTRFPVTTAERLYQQARTVWFGLAETDWHEAFQHHPQIGDVASLKEKFAGTSHWAAAEQGAVQHATQDVLEALAAGNAAYVRKFGYIFIVCATGKSAAEMYALLEARLPNAPADEIKIAVGEQAKITQLRLAKLLDDTAAA